MNNQIFLKFKLDILTDYKRGFKEYKQQIKDKLSTEIKNEIIIPANVKKISINFIHGLFDNVFRIVDVSDVIIKCENEDVKNKVIEVINMDYKFKI